MSVYYRGDLNVLCRTVVNVQYSLSTNIYVETFSNCFHTFEYVYKKKVLVGTVGVKNVNKS